MLWVRALRLSADRVETMLFAAGLGFGTLSLLLLGLGAAGLYSPGILKAVFLVLCGAALTGARWWWRWLPKDAPGPRARLGPWEGAAMALLALTIALEVCGALTPEIFYDSLVYHLALPELYLLKGRLAPIPYNIFSGLPLGMQMLYGLALALSDEKLASLLHLSLGLATAAAIYVIGKRFFTRAAGILAALSFLACPMTLYAGWGCGVDLGAGFYCIGAFMAMLCDLFAADDLAVQEKRPLWPACAGLLLGFACGTKYNVLPLAAVLVAVYTWQSRSWRGSAVMCAAAGAAFAPWLIKNIVLFGDPLYPYLRGMFGDAGWIVAWQSFVDATGSRSPAILRTLAGWKELLLQPWTASVGAWPMGDWPGSVYLMLVPWLFIMRPGRPVARALLAAAAGSYLVWALATNLVRFLLPAFSLMALCAALAVEGGVWPWWLRRIGWLVVFYGGLFNIQVAFRQGAGFGQWQYLMGQVSRADYLKIRRQTYPLPYFSAAEFINRDLPPRAKVLVLGESRTYYIERDCIAATVFDRNPFWTAAEQARDGDDLLSRVRGLGITHVFLSADQLIFRQDSPGILPRETARRAAFRDFWARHLKPLFEDREASGQNMHWLLVYEVVDRLDAGAAPTPNPVSVVLGALERPLGQ
jgi:hypothetical protein